MTRHVKHLSRMESVARGNGTTCIVSAIITILVMTGFLALIALRFNPDVYLSGPIPMDDARVNDYSQYNHLANSILDGKTYLELPVPSWLKHMDNPYDAGLRLELAKETGEPYYWDYAFYKGQYYCYFGVLPALIAFVPYKFVTGTDLRTDIAALLFAIAAMCAMGYFLYQLVKTNFKKISRVPFAALLVMLITGTGVITQVFIPFFYALPPLSGLACVFLGLGLWVSARRPEGGMSLAHLAGGSLFVSLSLGCRPQMFLAMLLAFPLFWHEIFKTREFFSKRGMLPTLAMCIPCVCVVGGAMWWNWVRFDSPFDFGAAYNLTGFDMTAKAEAGMSTAALLSALYFYVLAVPNPIREFPFFEPIPKPKFAESIAVEPFYGSVVSFTPAVLSVLLLPFVHKDLRHKHLLGFCWCSIALAIVLLLISPQVASVSMRYFSDFAWALLIPAACVWLQLIEASKDHHRGIALLLCIAVTLGFLMYAWTLLCNGRYHELSRTAAAVYEFFGSLFHTS